jgi:D-alanyl-D-alanine carboxypeptidase (penicillin-binding protein 5/6)
MIDLAYATMMMSANDAAIVLGEGVSGSEKEFVELMNDTLKEWGCENTHFVNTNGWDNKDHYTTARDMAIITKHCLENETLRKIAVTKKYTVPATNKNDELELDNALLKATQKIKGVVGGKTGSWSETQCAITYEFKDNGLDSIVVLLDDTAKGRVNDPAKLVDFVHKVTPGFIVTNSDKNVCEAWVKHGAVSKVPVDVKGLRYAYPKNQKASGVKVKTDFDKVEAPIKKGDRIGKYYIYANDEQVGQGYLYAGDDVKKGWLLSRFYVSNAATLVAAAILVLLIVFELLTRKKH